MQNLKYKYGNRIFWCRGYFVDTAGKNDKAIDGYIKNQWQRINKAQRVRRPVYGKQVTNCCKWQTLPRPSGVASHSGLCPHMKGFAKGEQK